MSSIGPQLPPHLQKRKRTPEDDADSPPAKVSRQASNDDEIPLDDDSSDDGYGPSVAAPKGPSVGPSFGPSIGPSLPPTTTPVAKPSICPALPPAPTNNDEIALDSDSDSNDIGPAAPAPAPKTDIGPSLPPPSSPKPKRVIGPAPPPAPLSERPATGPDSDSDSEDDWGPALPSATASFSRNIGPSISPTASVSESTAVPKRDSWMIAPPTDSSYRASDPTKLKARKFTAGPRANTEKGGGVSSIWTETPEQKLQRLTNAVLGREDPSAAADSGPSASSDPYSTKRKVDEERIKAFTEQTRGRSLVEEHQALKAAGKAKSAGSSSSRLGGGSKYGQPEGQGPQEEGDDDPSARPFDREKDMAIGGRLSDVKKREIMKSASNFGGRFQKGSYL
ncbi:Protein of unknown function (DUF3752) domain containing protein [Naviculisporaceae sp. PSN 640]